MAVIRHASFGARGFNARQVPSGPVELHAGHNLAAGLNAAFYFGLHPTRDFSPYGNHISRITGVFSNSPSQLGAARNTVDTTALLEFGIGGVGNNTPVSHVFWYVPSGAGTLSGGIGIGCISVQSSAGYISVSRQSAAQVAFTAWTGTFGRLHQVVVTYDNANVSIYTDGVLGTLTAYTTGFVIAPGGTNIIGWGDAGDSHFQGDLIQVRTYTRALSAAEVAQDYAEPFAMLRPAKRRLYYAPTAAAVASSKRPFIRMIA